MRHLIWLECHNCSKHNVSYLHHPNCYVAEHPTTAYKEKVGCIDIEASNLKADFGLVFCYVIGFKGGRLERSVTPRELRTCRDKKVLEQCVADILKFDRLVGHYSSRFDIPFLRARCEHNGIKFPEHKTIWQTDTWQIARNKLCISSNRLGNVAASLGITETKTRITPEHWLDALSGKQASLDYILEHCRIDVSVLMKVYDRLERYVPKSRTSI